MQARFGAPIVGGQGPLETPVGDWCVAQSMEQRVNRFYCVQSKLREFLALMPRDAVASAREQALVPS